jgi:hypothetical protein
VVEYLPSKHEAEFKPSITHTHKKLTEFLFQFLIKKKKICVGHSHL